ncbi:MAG: transposase [Candidatus Marinimicrobia bacterium]|nr:transposase [Candidatus Neomarinimicrobiota bacterium]
MTTKKDKNGFSEKLLDELMQNYQKPEDLLGENGNSKNTIKSNHGNFPVEVPRDRNSTFEPLIIPKGQTRFDGFDDKIISMYSRGMTTRDIQMHLQEIYNIEVSAMLISMVTNEVMNEVKAWQNRPLEAIYPIVCLPARSVRRGCDISGALF